MPHGRIRDRQQHHVQGRHDPPRARVQSRGAYVAAALTIVRAYLCAGSPKICSPLGSYSAWSTMVRSPLVWLGELDPVISMDGLRDEDIELANIREFFGLWMEYGLDLD